MFKRFKSNLICSSGVIAGMVSANYFWQGCVANSPDWTKAAERSWFEVVAVVMCCLILAGPPGEKHGE